MVGLLLHTLAAAKGSELPMWRGDKPAWSEQIGDPSKGVTGDYILSTDIDQIGVIFYAYAPADLPLKKIGPILGITYMLNMYAIHWITSLRLISKLTPP